MTKIITVPKELYGFLATPGIEKAKLVFDSDDVVCSRGSEGRGRRAKFTSYQ